MPEGRDKNGPPGLEIEIRCQHTDCRHVARVTGDTADRIAGRLWAASRRQGKLHMRELIARLNCDKCQRRLASVSFALAYRGHTLHQRQHHERQQFIPDEA
jgi:hypothetical protein